SFSGIHTNATLTAPAHYATAASLPQQGGTWPQATWANTLGGARLQQLVDEALANNPDLQVATARIAAARAAAQAARAATLPQVGAKLGSTYQRYTENGLIPPPLAGTWEADNELVLSASYDFDFWDRHGAQLRAALAQGKAASAEAANARLLLATAVAHSWLQLGRQQAQLQLAEQQLQLRDRLDQLTRQRIRAGLDGSSERQQSQLQLATLRADRTQWQEAIVLSRNQLAALLGQGPDRGLRINVPQLPTRAASTLPDQLPLQLLARRPDIVASRWRVEAATGDIAVAKAQFYPNINLSAFTGLSSLGVGNFLRSGSLIAGVGPAITLPIFDGGALRAQLRGKTAAFDGAVALYNQTVTEALHQVADQVQSLRAASSQSEERQHASLAAHNALLLVQQRQRVGTANMLQVIASESAWLAQRQLVLDSSVRQADLQIALIKALGGGFDAQQGELGVPAAQTNATTPLISANSHSD
ncbi:MAG: efflux transporter outer membrane subunit, partial [Herbaspirillum sp.]